MILQDQSDQFSLDMRNDMHVKDILPTAFQRRRKTLADITNLSLSASWVSDSKEGLVKKTASGKSSSSSETQLREENAALKGLLSEKEAVIETQASQLDRLQREFFTQLRRHSQVNEELISYNSRLAKDGGQLRDQLKLLQHEYSQMTVAYRVNQSELQAKLAESQELVTRLLQHGSSTPATDQSVPKRIPVKTRSRSAQRRHSVGHLVLEDDWNGSTKLDGTIEEEGVTRADISRRLSSVGVVATKEPTTRSRQTQHQGENSSSAAGSAAPYRMHQTNLYGDLLGLESMPEESCESDSPRASPGVSRSNTGVDSCKGGVNSASGLTTEYNSSSSRRTTRSDESAAASAPPASVKRAQSLNTNKVNQRVVSSTAPVSSTTPAPHFSRRASCNTLNTAGSAGSGRPVRRAVEKIASYVEPPLNTKMRRPS